MRGDMTSKAPGAQRSTWIRGWMRALAVLLPVLGMLVCAGTTNADTPLTFGFITVDNARGHVFVSLPSANAIDEFSFEGKLIAVIPDIYGAAGMVVDGDTLYVAENTTGEIVSLDLNSPAASPRELTSGLIGPSFLTMAGGQLWTALSGWDGQWMDSIVGVNPTSGSTSTLPLKVDYPEVFAGGGDPADFYVVDSQDPSTVYRYDASVSPAVQKADVDEQTLEFIDDLAISPDGSRAIPAAGYPYDFTELSGTTAQPDGVTYPGSAYPSAVAVSASGRLATGLISDNTPDVSVYELGIPQAIFNGETTMSSASGEPGVLDDGVALTSDGSKLYAVVPDSNGLELDTFDVTAFNGSGGAPISAPAAITQLTATFPAPPPPPPVSAAPTKLATPLAHLRRSAAHRHPSVSLTVGALRTPTVDETTNTVTGYTYTFDASGVRCGGRASSVSVSVAGSRRSVACRAGTFVISGPVRLGRTYRLSLTAIEVERHARRKGKTHVLHLAIPRDGHWTAT